MITYRFFLELDDDTRLGRGKIALLERIGETGSISAAGRAEGMPHRRAWELVDQLDRAFGRPLVTRQIGGAGGGGAALTDLGRDVVRIFRALEAATAAAADGHVAALEALVVPVADAPDAAVASPGGCEPQSA